jgi:hypothetical protein
MMVRPTPYVMETLNGMGMVGILTIWIVERIRCNNRKHSWRLSAIFSEIPSWVIFLVITFVLAGLPFLHAHLKMLLGSNLTFERTPKGILPKNHSRSFFTQKRAAAG